MGTRNKNEVFASWTVRQFGMNEATQKVEWLILLNGAYFIIIFGAPMPLFNNRKCSHSMQANEWKRNENQFEFGESIFWWKSSENSKCLINDTVIQLKSIKIPLLFNVSVCTVLGPCFAIQNQFSVQIYFNQFYQWKVHLAELKQFHPTANRQYRFGELGKSHLPFVRWLNAIHMQTNWKIYNNQETHLINVIFYINIDLCSRCSVFGLRSGGWLQ